MSKKTITTSKTTKTVDNSSTVMTEELKDILSRIRRSESYMERWHKNIEHWRLLYDMKHYTGAGKPGDVRYSDPTYTNTVDLSVGIMLGNELKIHAYGFAPTPKEQKNTGAIEKLIMGILAQNDERTESHQIYELFLNFNRDGGGVLYSPFDPDMEPKLENVEVRNGEKPAVYAFPEVPIITEVVDPMTIIGIPGGPKRWLMLGRREKRSVLDVETQYNVKLPGYIGLTDEGKSNSYGIFYDVWDWVWVEGPTEPTQEGAVGDDSEPVEEPKVTKTAMVRNTILFENLPIIPPRIMEGYGDLPYSIQFFNPTGKEPKDWRSIVSPLETSVMLLERTFNRRAKQIDTFTALPLVVKTQQGRSVEIEPGLYNTIEITPDESIEFAQWPGNPPEVQFQMEFLRSRIQQSGFSDIMFGSGNNQIAGYALSQLGDQNRIRLQQPIKHIELLLTTWARKVLDLLDSFASDTLIYVYGRNKGEDYVDRVFVNDLKGYAVRAEVRPNFPNEEMRKVAMSTQVKGLVSDYTRMERYLGIEQPEDENERKIIEAAFNHPLMLKYGILSKLFEEAKNGDKIADMVIQGEMSKPASNPQGRPNQGNKPEQLTGLQSPTGQPPEVSVTGAPPGASAQEQAKSLANTAPNLSGTLG